VTTWHDRAIALLQDGQSCVLITVVETEGSAPREAGSKMLVFNEGTMDSIGGGHLEFKAIDRAQAMLGTANGPVELLEFSLGPSLGQCCGGWVQLMVERLGSRDLGWLQRWPTVSGDMILVTDLGDGSKTVIEETGPVFAGALDREAARLRQTQEPVRLAAGPDGRPCYVLEQMTSLRQDLYLFGAGHVGRALVHVLADLPYRIRWFDARTDMFPAAIPDGVAIEASADPRHDVASAPPGALFLVMTHSHALDFDICDQVLRRSDFGFLGLIGSATKRATFFRRLGLRGHSQASIRRLTCPIGLAAITGKAPAAVAISVAGQLLGLAQISKKQAAARRTKA
jgi:xanthine dehydrogenase accessory factor